MMSTREYNPGAQIINDGAVIRIEKDSKILLVAKDQVKTIDTVHENIVRIDIGEGPLKNVFLNYLEVAEPTTSSADELRDAIKSMMMSDQYDGGDAKESTQLLMLTHLGNMVTLLQSIKEREYDFSQAEPSRVDESNPYTIYRGWHARFGVPDQNEWAIERITRVGDEIIHEWAFGHKKLIYQWNQRETLNYAPYDHELPIPAPLPLAEGPGGGDYNPQFDPGFVPEQPQPISE
jgi:hypothetical protein